MWQDDYVKADTPENISGTDYDIAHVKWGGNWRMPTWEQINELISQCTMFWTKQNGVDGILVTGPNGNTIFLPAAGYRSYNIITDRATEKGFYWSSKLHKTFDGNAFLLVFDETGWENKYLARAAGYSVRAVTD